MENNLKSQKTDFITFPIAKPIYKDQFQYFPIDIQRFGQNLKGSLLKLYYPTSRSIISSNSSFSILNTHKEGCGHLERTSSASKNWNCDAGVNAGFFNMLTGSCIGNLVINGTIKNTQSSSLSSPNFGILSNNNYFFGYLTDSDFKNMILKKQIVYMVSGVVWLIKNEKIIVNDSISYEKPSTGFCKEKAPRVSIGINSSGNLLILEINGYEPEKKGVDLWEFAEIFKDFGAVNAINLDGGGSASVYVSGKLLSTCSDKCPISMNKSKKEDNLCPNKDKCERKVSTFLCLRF